MENPTLQKNLECIELYNPKLKEDLLALKELKQDFQLVETELAEPNLIYNGIPLHSQQGADSEAKKSFATATNIPTSIHIVFGIGIGHLFKEFCDHSKGIVILYEPNLEILRLTLELVDFSNELFKKNIKVVSDFDSFKNVFINNYSYNAHVNFSSLSSYREIYKDDINEIIKQIELLVGTCQSEYTTVKNLVATSVQMMIDNLPYTLNDTPVWELKDCYKGETAVIASAGPSLDNCIEAIKRHRDNITLFCVGPALKALLKNGIKPDFLNVIEVNDCSGQVKGADLSDINLILEPYTHNFFHKVKTKQKFIFPTNSSHANNAWAQFTGVDISPYEAKGTVSYEAISCAKMMGFKKIILVGQDLAFANNQCYSKDSAYSELEYEINPETNQVEIKAKDQEKYIQSLTPDSENVNVRAYINYSKSKINNLNSTLYFIKGVTGEMIPTQGNYATFVEHFREFASNNQDLDLINSSMIGAQIDGFKNIEIEKALEETGKKSKVDFSSKKYAYDKNYIAKKLDEEKALMENLLKEFEKAQEYIFKYERDFRRHKKLNQDSMRYFKMILGLYSDIEMEYKSKSYLFNALSFAEDIEIQHLLKQSENITEENILVVYEKLKRFYNITGQKIFESINKLNATKEAIIESTDSKS